MKSQQENYVETPLATTYGDFLIRVYPEGRGRETVVLRSKNLDSTQAPLVRVHSECMTGDTFGSLHCDCGKQLAKSLDMIEEGGGVLIYLRQEGRGIGLFDKIKAYKLQTQGYDTFEANVLLGHQPDERTYEKVKEILDDLRITRIRLITNNPSKVSEIARLGINVVERVPLVCKPNKHNKLYLQTKEMKFQHFLQKSEQYYYYQFPIDDPSLLPPLVEFIRQNIKDPLLKIGVGIAANHSSLQNQGEEIRSMVEACASYPELVPNLHFSFKQSPNILQNLETIKKLCPSLQRLQLNDLPSIELDVLNKATEMFTVDLPLANSDFDIVHKKPMRNFIKQKGMLVLLDNSKGKGVQEDKAEYIRKIDILHKYGINNIALCGGFGPDQLTTYFDVRRYYRNNFSIDAETNLKSNGTVDLAKVKRYLEQLICFDAPKASPPNTLMESMLQRENSCQTH